MKVSIIIPALNEATTLEQCLQPLQKARASDLEVILVDGGSIDNTIEIAEPLVDLVVSSHRAGRAVQMNLGAQAATGELLLFLHADTLLDCNVLPAVINVINGQNKWGRFDVSLSGHSVIYRLIETMINLRSRVTGIATGDQAIFLTRELFDDIGGFPELALMEDIALSKLLRKKMKSVCLREKVITSSRRWEENGVIRTILTMWILRLKYILGISPETLAREYDRV